MTLNQLLSLLATILGAIGAIYVLRSILRLSPYNIERLSATKYGHNIDLMDSLSSQKAEGIVGASLVLFALSISIINEVITPPETLIFANKVQAVFVTFVLAMLIILPMVLIGKIIDSNNRRAAIRIIIANKLDMLFKSNNIPSYELRSLRFLAERYFKLKPKSNDPPMDLLRRLAKDVGRTVPDKIEIKE